MKEYIERKALIEALKRECENLYYASEHELIRTFPAADVEPVRHGEWIGRRGTRQYDDYYCSLCGVYEEGTRNRRLLGNYCSHCGAKMDGGKNNAN